MEIKKAKPEDGEKIQKLFQWTIENLSSSSLYSEEQLLVWKESGDTKEFWAQKINSDYFIIAHSANEELGFGSLTNNYEIDLLYISPLHQKKQVGSIIIQELIEEAKRRNYKRIYTDSSLIAKNLFLKHGFMIEKTYKKTSKKVLFENTILYLNL